MLNKEYFDIESEDAKFCTIIMIIFIVIPSFLSILFIVFGGR